MIDNQAAQQGEGGFLDSLRDAAQRRAPESGSVLDQLRSLGVDPASLTRRPETPLTSEQRSSLLLDNALSMGGQFISDAWQGRRSDIDPYAAVSSIAEAGATKMLGETVGAAVGGVVGEIANLVGFSAYAPNWVSEQVFGMSSGEALDSAFGAVGLEPPTLLRMAIDRNMSSAAFDDSVMENRLRAVDPKASRTEASAAIGEYDPMSAPGIAKAFSTAATQLGTAIGMSMIPGGQAAGAATAARSVGVIGRVLAPARAMLTNPGGKAYLGYMGGRQAIDRGADYRRFFEREQQAANVYNDALDRTGLADILGKHEVPQDSRLEQFGVSVASGLMTAASELIGTGFSVAAGRRIASRLLGRYPGRAIEGGMGAVLREAGKKAVAAGGMEGLEEVVDGYGQALIGGMYDWTEEGGWAWSERTGEPMSFLKVAQNHAPNLMYDFAIAFMVSAPLGGAGGLASVRRGRNLHDAFTMALLRDRMAQAETGSNPGEADFAAAQIIAESMANPGGDGAATQTVLARLREVMPEIGQVTESQLTDPAWVRSFVENFPILAMRLSEMDSLSRMNIEWLTGPASRGRVPGSAARGQFLESLRSEMRTLIPTYMQGWFDRSADEIRQYNAQLQQLGNRTDDEARSLRALARSRIHFIQDVRKRVQQAWLNKETIDQSTFQSWLRLSEASEAVDLDGTADAVENSPHTERTAPDDIKSLLDLARQGDNEASFELARRYEAGEGVEQHYYKSQYWLNLALSRLGDVDAMVWMGKYYEGRIQTYPPTANQPRSIDKARALYRRAYEMGSDEAGGLLAELESRGQPTPAVPRPGRVGAASPAQAPQAAPAASAAPAPSVPQESARKPQAASEGVRTPKAAAEAPAASEAATEAPAASEADPAAATRRAVEERMRVEREAQAEAAAREADAAAAEADAPRAEVERQVQEAIGDDALRVRFVEAETDVERRIAKGAGKLGRRVQFITIMRDTPREGMRRRRSWSGIRGFVGRDADTIYLVRVPQVAQSDRAATAYYLQTLSHENAHGLIQDADQGTLEKVDALLNRELIMEMMAFDMGRGEDAREEIRVHTLTLGVTDAAALDAILLADTAASKVKARLKVLFSRVKFALTGNERAALLQKLVRDQVARVKAAEAAKPKPATAASLNAAVAAGDTVTATTERGGEMQEVTYGKDAEFIERRGVLYAKIGKVLERLDSPSVVPAKPAVGKAKAKKAAPKPEAKAQPAATPKPEAKVDPANEPVASELPRPKRGRGKRGDGQQAMFMREKQWGMPRMGSAFSGMGTWEIALRGLAEPVRGVEISPNIAVAYALNNGDHVEVTDVTKVPSDFAKDMDLFCASPVCKAYSDANRNRGEQGLDIASANWVASVVRDSRPANIAIENVPSYRSSEAYKIIEASLREAGYQFDAAVYDASDFGAATSRKRLIIRATLGTLPAAPSPTHGVAGTAKVGWMEAAGDLLDSLPPAPPIKEGSLVDQWLQEEGGLGSEPLLIMGSPPGRGTRRKGIRTTRKGNEPSPTIKATPKEVIRVWTGSEMKRATPRFLARLHGITDDVALPSEERLAKTVIGNGIPLQLVRAVVGPMVQPDGGLRFMREIDPNIDMLPSFKVAGQTVRDALLSTPKNHPYRDIAVAIAEFPIPSMAEDRVGSERSTTLNFYSYDAAFEGQPRINLSMYTKYSTLIHEAVHAFTAESVKRSMLFAIGRRDLAAAEGVDPASLSDDAVFMARRLAKANLIERWELDGLLKAQSEDARQSLLKMALLKRYVKDVKGDANIRTDAGYMAMVEAAIADPKTPVPVKRLLELFVQAKAESDIKATATPNNRLMAPGGWDTVETGEAQSEADAQRMRESLDIAYGLSNPLEFSAMAFSSPPFQRWLNERGGDGRKSLWQRFVAIVSRILGVKNDSMLESVIDASADLSQVRPDSVRFMRERSDSQLAADHAAAFERGDAEAATAIVREYGRRKGYAYFGYHGGDTEFTEFMHPWERAERDGEDYESDGYDGGNLGAGFYFTPDRHYASKFGVARSFLLRISNPIDSTDPDTMSFLEELEQSMIEDTGDVSPGEVYDAAMDERGADGVIAKDAGGFSFGAVEYMVREPSQIKLADPFTYDKDGKLIPLDKRFDDSTGDIRFMRERVVDTLDSFRDESPSSSRTNRLATELMWKYTVLDRAVKAARRKMNIDPEDAANELFQLAPGIVSRMLQDFGNAEQKPFEEAVKALAKRLGISRDRVFDKVQEHAFYKHALDVMAWVKDRDAEEIARRAERQQEMLTDMGVDVDPDALYAEVLKAMTALGVDQGKASERLAEIEKEFAADPAWSNLSDQLRAMNRRTLEIRRESGQITEAAYQELVQRYPNYVPVVVSIFDESVTGEIDEVTRPARRALRSMRGIGESKRPIREYWAANWDLTKADRMSAAHAASLMPGDNAMFRLAMMEALKTASGENLLEVVDMQDMIRREVIRIRMSLTQDRDAAARKARERGEEPAAFEMPSDEVLTERAAQKVRTDLDMEVAGTSTQMPTVRRFKLERDMDMTDPRVYDDIDLFARTGLTVAQTEANEQARADGKPLPHTPVKAGTKAHERKMEQLQDKIRIMPKATVMHYRIMDPMLAQAMLLNEPTWIEKWRNEGGKIKRSLALGWLKLMAYQRFAFVTASPGFWKGELFRSPQQAQIMARVMSQEMGLSPEVQEEFLRNVDALNGAPVWPLVGVFGAFKALPGRKPWRSVRHVLRGGDPRNEYETLVRQAMEDGVMQGSLYSVADYESMQADLRDRVRRLTGASGTRMDRAREAISNSRVVDVMKTVTDSIDMITGGLDFVNRMVVYQAALMSGISRQQAAVMARESTVDFSKKGTKTRGLSQMYLFLGPRMQGIHQLLRAFSTGDGAGAARIATSASMRALMRMFLWAFVIKMMREFFWEDDDEPQTQPSQFASLQNMLIPMPLDSEKGQHIYLELNNPYGFGAIAKLADRIGEFLVGDATPLETIAGATGDFASELTPLAFNAADPSSIIQAVTPTNLQFATDLILNQDWKGSPVYPEGAKFGPGEQRRSQQYFAANTWRTSIWMADVIADLTRPIAQGLGFEGQRGIEISPNQIQYVFQRWMPGLVRQAVDGASWATGSRVTVDRLPIIGSFVTQTGGQGVLAGQWRDLGTIRANMKVDIKEGRENRRDLLERYGAVGRWLERGAYDRAANAIKKLQQARNQAERAGQPRERINRLDDRIEEIRERVLREYAMVRQRETGGGIDQMVGESVRGRSR